MYQKRRKRLTQYFPWLLPIRRAQKKWTFYSKMKIDGKKYAKSLTDERLNHCLYECRFKLYNPHSGLDPIYQENKVFNLKLAVETLNGLIIKPSEYFSFWQCVRHADKETPYREGLFMENDVLLTAPGGGLCLLSNQLFWMFLHSPMTLVERMGHRVKSFPDMTLKGVDATIYEGWIDLKVKNKTLYSYQLNFEFTEEELIGRIYSDVDLGIVYSVENRNVTYYQTTNGIIESADVYRISVNSRTQKVVGIQKAYTNSCKIEYPLPEGTPLIEKGQ